VAPAGSSNRRLIGLLAVLPALLALLYSYVWPSLWTLWTSFTGHDPIRSGAKGHSDYGGVFGDFGRSVGYSLGLAVVPLIAVLVVAPGLAFLAARAGTTQRRVVRVLLTLPLATVAPIVMLLSWRRADRITGSDSLAGLWPFWMISFGLVSALAFIAYLAAFRRADGRSPGRSALLVAVVAVCAVLAGCLQVAVTGAVSRGPGTPVTLLMRETFLVANFSGGTAVAVLLGLVLGLLGLVTTLALVFGRVRVEFRDRSVDPAAPPAPPGSPLPGGLALFGAGVVVLLLGYAVWPWLSALADGEISMSRPGGVDVSVGRILLNTWVPPLPVAVVGVGLAALAGYGIGALRPLGPRSELLLLPFAPWLFVGIMPLVPHAIAGLIDRGGADGFVNLIPPVWLSIPALFLTTLFFRGQNLRRAAAPGEAPGGWGAPGQPVRPSGALLRGLPLIGALFVLAWVGYANNYGWQYVASGSEKNVTAIAGALRASQAYFRNPDAHLGIGLASLPPLVVLVLAGLIALQLLYLDRLVITSGDPDEPAPAAAHPYPPTTAGYPFPAQPAYPPAPVPHPAYSPPGYPPATQPGYPPTGQQGYPPATQPGYPPPAQPGYQPGYPPAGQQGYPPPAQPGYQPGYPPPAQPGYPPAGQQGYPPANPSDGSARDGT
jgi:hypothetical protein